VDFDDTKVEQLESLYNPIVVVAVPESLNELTVFLTFKSQLESSQYTLK